MIYLFICIFRSSQKDLNRVVFNSINRLVVGQRDLQNGQRDLQNGQRDLQIEIFVIGIALFLYGIYSKFKMDQDRKEDKQLMMEMQLKIEKAMKETEANRLNERKKDLAVMEANFNKTTAIAFLAVVVALTTPFITVEKGQKGLVLLSNILSAIANANTGN